MSLTKRNLYRFFNLPQIYSLESTKGHCKLSQDLPQGEEPCWTSFVLSRLGRGVYLAMWNSRVRRLHVSPQSGLPRSSLRRRTLLDVICFIRAGPRSIFGSVECSSPETTRFQSLECESWGGHVVGKRVVSRLEHSIEPNILRGLAWIKQMTSNKPNTWSIDSKLLK